MNNLIEILKMNFQDATLLPTAAMTISSEALPVDNLVTMMTSSYLNTTLPEPYVMSTMDIVFVTVVSATSFLSIPSCVIIVVMYMAIKSLRTTGRAMLVQLTIADLLTAIGNLLGVMWYLFRDSPVLNRSMAYCEFHSALTIFSSIASFLWTTVTGLSLYWAIIQNKPNTADKYWVPIWLICWVIPTVITIAALSMRVLGYDAELNQASWCWIDPGAKLMVLWNFLTGKAWELVAYVLSVILYGAVKLHLIRHKSMSKRVMGKQSSRDRNKVSNASTKLTFIPLVFIVIRLWGTVRFMWGFIDHDSASSPTASWIVPLQGFGDTAQGLCNFIMDVLFARNVRRHLFRLCTGGAPDSMAESTFSEKGDNYRPRMSTIREDGLKGQGQQNLAFSEN